MHYTSRMNKKNYNGLICVDLKDSESKSNNYWLLHVQGSTGVEQETTSEVFSGVIANEAFFGSFIRSLNGADSHAG